MLFFGSKAQDCNLAQVIQVDGKTDEWPLTWMTEDEFSFNVCADAQNLYIRMKTDNDVARRKIGLYGFTLWLDPNGKKKRKLGLRYPTGVEAKERMDILRAQGEGRQMSAGERVDFQRSVNRKLIENIEILELLGLADEPVTSTITGITNGLKVAIASDDGVTYYYEAIIPFKAFRLSKAAIEELGVGFETGRYIPPKVSNSSSSNKTTPPPGSNVPSIMYQSNDAWTVLKLNTDK